jgi:hypothetical protein
MLSVRKAIDLIGTGQTIWGWLQLLFPGLGAGVTGVLAYGEGARWSIIIFLTSGVLCFLSASVHYTSRWWRDNTVKGKIRLEMLQITQIWKQRPTDDCYALNCVFIIKNHSMLFDLYYKIEDVLLILQGHTGDKDIRKQIIILPPGAIGAIQAPTILGINAKEPTSGTATLKISFGTDEKHLRNSYEVEGLPNVAFGIDDKGNVAAASANILFRSVTYT